MWLARTSGKSHRQIADDLDVTSETLPLWLKQAVLEDGTRQDALTSDKQEELRRLRREVHILREEREILKKAAAFSGEQLHSVRVYEFVECEKAHHLVRRMCRMCRMCRMLGVSPSDYRTWRQRGPPARTHANEEPRAQILQIHHKPAGGSTEPCGCGQRTGGVWDAWPAQPGEAVDAPGRFGGLSPATASAHHTE